MRVLVTGGAGFIGSHIVDALIDEGIEVAIVDDLSTGSRQNINPKASFHHVSLLDRKLKHVFKVESPDAVIHEAAQTVISRSLRDPAFDARVNILGSIRLLDNCVHFGVGKVIYASSCAIYGPPRYLPLDEGHPQSPISPYGVSKLTVERYLQVYQGAYGLDYCVLRYANVFGPRQNPGGEAGIMAIFSRQMLAGEQPRIYGNGDKTRSYVCVSDVARANVLALNSTPGSTFNIGASTETTDQQVFDLISRAAGYEGPPKYVAERPGDVRHMCLDCRRAAADLGWSPETPLEEGVARTVDFYRVRPPAGAAVMMASSR